jgi:hypothetical protein
MILLRIQISFSCRRRLNKPWILNRASNFLAACAVWSRKEIHGIGLSRLRRQKVFEYTYLIHLVDWYVQKISEYTDVIDAVDWNAQKISEYTDLIHLVDWDAKKMCE